jgi:hypothetical protein
MSSGPSSSKIRMKNSSTSDAILTSVNVALQVGRLKDSSATNYKLVHISCSCV